LQKKINQHMKKLVSLILVAGTCALVSCGPSKEEQEATAKATADSIAQVEAAAQKAMEDSMAMVQKAMDDSISAANMKAMQDSLDAMKANANKPKPKPKSTEEKKKEEAKKATQGRG
jgi:predicted outer membrane protein